MNRRVVIAVAAGLAALAGLTLAAENGRVRINLDEPSSPPARPAETPKTPPPTAPKTGPANAPAAGKSDPAGKAGTTAKKKPEPPKIEGLLVARGDKGFLAVKIDGGFRVSFYDREKMPVEADVSQIVLRWPVTYQRNPERALLTPAGDGKTMVSPRIVRPPYAFKLFITLLKDVPDAPPEAVETYVIDFNQE